MIRKLLYMMHYQFGSGKAIFLCASDYESAGKIDLNKFSPITYDPINHTYRKIGDVVGKVFSDGMKLK